MRRSDLKDVAALLELNMKRFAFAALFALPLFSLACGGSPATPPAAPAPAAPAADAETPVPGDWLVSHLPVEMPHLNPITSSDAYATRIMAYIFEGLLDRDPETLEMVPLIAKSWEISEDHLTYTFHLRDDAKFSDGTPITAHDVKFTYDVIMDPKTDAPHLRNYFNSVASCEAVDDFTVRYTCSEPYFLHLLMLGSIEVLPRHVYGTGDFNQARLRDPLGSGPYVLESWKTGQEIVLTRNPGYWNAGARPVWLDKHVFRVITDDNAAFQVLSRGDLDLMAIRPEDWVDRANTPNFNAKFNKESFYVPSFGYIGWNARRPQFADKRVRRALTMLLDRETILDTIYHGLARPLSAGIMPDTPEYNAAILPHPFDPAAAAALLDEAGWVDSDGDGLRDKDGVPFRFETLITDGSPSVEAMLTLFQEELKRVGIRLEIRVSDWAAMVERVQKREFDSMMMGWQMTPDPDPYQLWHSSQADAGSNYVGFVNEEADRLIEQNRVNFNRDERAALMQRFHEIMHEEQPYTFLFSAQSLVAVDKRLHGVVFHPMVPSYPRLEWYVPASLQRYGK
jgi:peptide/nickel transport system substrate-binding protein